MRTARSLEPSIPVKDRLSMRLALLFFGSFAAVLVVLIAWTMLSTIADRQQAAAQSEIAAPAIVIDPKIKADLAKAMAFDALPVAADVYNPFLDRAGIASNVVVSGAPAASQTGTTSGTSGPGSGSSSGGAQTSLQVGPSVVMAPAYDVKARYDDWIARQKRGEFVGPESEVLSVEDLVPVGYASGGDRGEEVMLFSVALCRTFSFPAGTRFFDGWVNGFDQKEVVFTFQDGIRRKSYSTADQCVAGDSRLAAITGQP